MLDYPLLLAADPIVVYSEGPREGIATLAQLGVSLESWPKTWASLLCHPPDQ